MTQVIKGLRNCQITYYRNFHILPMPPGRLSCLLCLSILEPPHRLKLNVSNT